MQYKAAISRLIAIVFLSLSFIVSWKLLRYVTVDDSKSYTRLTMHEFYEQNNIDILFMGASHCYRGFDTQITDKLLGCNTFNLGSSSQGMDVTLLLLQEALKLYDVDQVYLEVSNLMALEPMDSDSARISTYAITDYMKPSVSKYALLLKKSVGGYYVNSFLPARRNWENLFHWQEVQKILAEKNSPDYVNYAYVDNETERYAGKGFVEGDKYLEDNVPQIFSENKLFEVEDVNASWVECLKTIIRMCEEKDVKLTLVSTPILALNLLCNGNYDEYIEFIKEIIAESGSSVDYLDFNLLREKYWPNTASLFMDDSHLNGEGARKFSELFCQYIKGEIGYQELFYNNVAEKYSSMNPSFFGIVYTEPESLETSKSFQLVFNHPENTLSRVTLILDEQDGSENEQTILIKDWSMDENFQIPMNLSGKCQIEVSFMDDSTSTNVYCYDF